MIRIVAAEPHHAAVLANVHARCFRDSWTGLAFRDWLNRENTFVLLAVIENRTVGLVVFRVAADECEVLTLGVVLDHRNAGVGVALMRAAISSAIERGAKAMFLEVEASNAPALALYRKLDFVEVGERRDYYRNCESFADALVLRCTLTDGN